MIRVREYTRKKEKGVPCDLGCMRRIEKGDRYRELIAVRESDAFGENYVRLVAHEECACRREGWHLRDDAVPHADPRCEYVRTTYKLDIRRGSRVIAGGKPGRVEGATNHVWVKRDGERHPFPFHPNDVKLPEVPSAAA